MRKYSHETQKQFARLKRQARSMRPHNIWSLLAYLILQPKNNPFYKQRSTSKRTLKSLIYRTNEISKSPCPPLKRGKSAPRHPVGVYEVPVPGMKAKVKYHRSRRNLNHLPNDPRVSAIPIRLNMSLVNWEMPLDGFGAEDFAFGAAAMGFPVFPCMASQWPID